ncbi:MAG TPA: helix-turn-helix domain-containing protein [Hanamia sp.]
MDNIILSPIPLDTLLQSLRSIIKEEIQAEQLNELQEKLLSPAEACKIFQPKISKPTLTKWADNGLIQERKIGGRIFFKYSDLIEAAKTLKKYKKPVVTS